MIPNHLSESALVDVIECMIEANGDVEAGLAAAEQILDRDSPAVRPEPLSVFLAHDIHNRAAQGILNRSLKAARTMSAAARADLAAALAKGAEGGGGAILEFIDRYRLQLASLLTQTQLASLLEGAREVAGKVPVLDADAAAVKQIFGDIPQPKFPTPDGIHFPVIDEASRELAAKNVLTRRGYDALDAAARAKAFTVAGVDAQDTLEKIRDALAENVEKGADYATFRTQVLAAVDEGTFLSDAHQEVVFRTNVQTGFSDGQMTVLNNPLVRSGFPYAAYDAIHNDRVRHNHLALEKLGIVGTNVYRNDDPVFQTFRPPWDYQDRCSWVPLTVRQAAERGIPEAVAWLETGVEPSPPAFVPMPPFSPPAGFQRSVLAAPLSIRLSMQPLGMFAPEQPPEQPRPQANNLSPDDYPRNAANQFVPKESIAEAARDPERLAELRESLPEEERPKLDRAVSHLQWGGTIHHPKEAPGLAVGMDGKIADPRWALRDAWEARDADRRERAEKATALTRLIRAVDVTATTRALTAVRDRDADLTIGEVRESIGEALARVSDHFDEVESTSIKSKSTPAEMRAVSRLRRQADVAIDARIEGYVAALKRARGRDSTDADRDRLADRFDDLSAAVLDSCARVTDLYEEIAEQSHLRIETESAADPEPDAPEEPVNPGISGVEVTMSTDVEGHQHKGKGTGGGQFTGTGGGGGAEPAKSKARAAVDKVKKSYDWLHDTGHAGFHRLPTPIQKTIATVFSVVMVGWTASQKVAERISLEKGSTPEQAAQTRSILAAADILAFKPIAVATAPLGAVVAAATWVVPPVTACYLAHSTVRHPIATYRAARGIVKDLVAAAKEATPKPKPGPYSAFMDKPTKEPPKEIALGMEGDVWHGPSPPAKGKWVEIEPGPRGGKRWRQSGGGSPAVKPDADRNAAPTPEPSPVQKSVPRPLPTGQELESGQAKRIVGGGVDTATGTSKVYKVATDTGEWFVKQIKREFRGKAWEGSARNEVLISTLASYDGVKTPPTTETTYQGEPAVVTPWLPGKALADLPNWKKTVRSLPPEEISRQVLFTWLLDVGDRHEGNYFLTPEGELYSIDHEVGFEGFAATDAVQAVMIRQHVLLEPLSRSKAESLPISKVGLELLNATEKMRETLESVGEPDAAYALARKASTLLHVLYKRVMQPDGSITLVERTDASLSDLLRYLR